MKKLQTTLIVITFLVAIFFFGKWINDVRPRYEWQERIEHQVFPENKWFNCIYEYTKKYCFCTETLIIEKPYIFWGEELVDYSYERDCYIKEKVKL